MQVSTNSVASKQASTSENIIRIRSIKSLINRVALAALAGLCPSLITRKFVAIVIFGSISALAIFASLITDRVAKNMAEKAAKAAADKAVKDAAEKASKDAADKAAVLEAAEKAAKEAADKAAMEAAKKAAEADAATKFQTAIRGITAKDTLTLHKENRLDPGLVIKARSFFSDLGQLPTATWGLKRNQIKMPKEIPVVIRTYDFPLLEERRNKLEQANKLIRDNRLKLIEVPKARIQGNFLIEERIAAVGNAHASMAFYYANPHKFDESAVEFALFLTKCDLSDICGNIKCYSSFLWPNLEKPRYDNVMLLESGKISPVDLDTFDVKDELTPINNFDAAKKSIILFPFQYDLIMAKLQESKPFKQDQIDALQNIRAGALNALDEEVGKHFRFLAKFPENVHNKVTIPIEAIDRMKKNLRKTLLDMHEKKIPLNRFDSSPFLGDHPEEALKFFEDKIFPYILNYFEEILNTPIESSSLDKDHIDFEIFDRRNRAKFLVQDYEEFLGKKEYDYRLSRTELKNYTEQARIQYCNNIQVVKPTEVFVSIIDELIKEGFIANKIVNKEFVYIQY